MLPLTRSSFILGTMVVLVLSGPNGAHSQDKRGSKAPESLSTTSGQSSSYRMDDSTYYIYGDFTVISSSSTTEIKAHRLQVSTSPVTRASSFRNDFMAGRLISEGLEIHTNYALVHGFVTFSADQVHYSEDSLQVRLLGNATFHGDDVTVTSPSIVLYLNKWTAHEP